MPLPCKRPPLGSLQLAVIVAVSAVRMMQVPVHEVIRMVAVRNGFVPASRSMLVPGFMTGAGMRRSAGIRVGRAHRNHMLIHVVAVRLVQVPVVQVIYVPFMLDGHMAAPFSVHMRVPLMDLMFCHGISVSFIEMLSAPRRLARPSPACASAFCTRSATC